MDTGLVAIQHSGMTMENLGELETMDAIASRRLLDQRTSAANSS